MHALILFVCFVCFFWSNSTISTKLLNIDLQIHRCTLKDQREGLEPQYLAGHHCFPRWLLELTNGRVWNLPGEAVPGVPSLSPTVAFRINQREGLGTFLLKNGQVRCSHACWNASVARPPSVLIYIIVIMLCYPQIIHDRENNILIPNNALSRYYYIILK